MLSVEPETLTVSAVGGSALFTVTSNIDWNVSETCDWLTATKTSNTILTVDYDENVTVEERSADITLSGPGVSDVLITLNQDGAVPVLSVEPETLTVSAVGGSALFTVTSNIDWSVSETCDWLTATKTTNTVLTVEYDENRTVDERTAVITLSGPGVSDVLITLDQEGAVPVLSVEPETLTVSPASGSALFTVTSNIDWSVSETCDWLTATKISNTVLTVEYDENRTVDERTAVITLSGPGVSDVLLSFVQEVQIANGYEEYGQAPEIEVYPNPSKGKFDLVITGIPFYQIYMEIVNVKGELIFKRSYRNNETDIRDTLDISEFSKGNYILRFIDENAGFIKEIMMTIQ